ncbi:complexed with Cdc5 protein Cwf18 [Schizosaccharomyces japonicus yFS275]|uniref:Complexed with Cdc5 protein Cwf18 n=1 Tax=Schizosaccharomyces japonicus (strain yFS275 / FY16936) TaxID=402676 RepID=B6JYY7_SCHJY|nr:complexed with Cdc5 protein Cwf18 [Schizosaccharomyces japonicus yFS275]EEB06755.1 complexed with Cdc5 protein Cwf18 [Schizosaccharomyces japonicus yFS275]
MSTFNEASESRKQRLAELRRINQLQREQQNHEGNDNENETNSSVLKFRNYDPVTQAPKMGFVEPPTIGEETVEKVAANIEEETQKVLEEQQAIPEEELDLTSLRPKKATWDLERDLKERMTALETATQNAKAYYIRQTIEERKKQASQEQAV